MNVEVIPLAEIIFFNTLDGYLFFGLFRKVKYRGWVVADLEIACKIEIGVASDEHDRGESFLSSKMKLDDSSEWFEVRFSILKFGIVYEISKIGISILKGGDVDESLTHISTCGIDKVAYSDGCRVIGKLQTAGKSVVGH